MIAVEDGYGNYCRIYHGTLAGTTHALISTIYRQITLNAYHPLPTLSCAYEKRAPSNLRLVLLSGPRLSHRARQAFGTIRTDSSSNLSHPNLPTSTLPPHRKWPTTSPPSSAPKPTRSTAPSTTKSVPAVTATAVPANTSSPRTRKPSSSPTCTRTPPTTPKTR
ncbi:hypothetical protein EYC84_006412 [Monilinia fructicola]|uniref:Uncharacterized protein n=1 Tax=Monilinia fructicola TaxID=38448 RepID=A0A5M9K388_MONFR|nr:hypothetical protein EYC84_006412 [Monilinia fructicola]